MSRARVKYDEKLGVWYARPYIGINPITRKKMRPYKQFPEAVDEASAQALADKWFATISPTGKSGAGLSFPDMCELYIRDRKINGLAASTVDTYTSIVNAQIKPLLSKVDPRHVYAYNVTEFVGMLLKPSEDGGRGLKRNTVRKTLSFLKKAFKWFVKQGLTDINPIYEIDMPKHEDVEARSLTPDEITALMSTIDEILAAPAEDMAARRLYAAAVAALIAFYNATRIGETCSLKFGSFNTIRRDVRISSQASETKSAGFSEADPKYNSKSTINIGDETIAAVKAMRSFLKAHGINVTSDTYLVTVDGKMTRPSDLRRWFKRLLKKAGLSTDIVFHTLRHTHATLLIAAGWDMKSVSERLRHKDVATTMRIYAHVMPGRDAETARAFSDIAKEFRL